MSAVFAQLHFLRPAWLWALLLLPLLAWTWQRRRQRDSVWREAVDPHLLPHLLDAGGVGRGLGSLAIALVGLALAVLALSGPAWRKVEQPLMQVQSPLVVALDLSTAVLARDLQPSRLLQVRAKLASLLEARRGGQVGLVAFADDAYTVAPLTDDVANVALFLDALAPDVMPADGSRAGRAIERGVALIHGAGFDRGTVLLVGDHADAAALVAARQAAAQGVQVSALGAGTRQGASYRRGDGAIAQARLDAASLQALARAGEGRYHPLTADRGDLEALGVLAGRDASADAARHGETASLWRDEGYWLLLPLGLLALLAFRRGALFAMVLGCALWPALPAGAAEVAGTPWRRADQQEHARLRQGTEAYRKGDFAAAARAWGGLRGPDATYNRGNALARAGRYEEAIAAYDEALRRQPGMADAIANRQAVLAAMQRRPPPGPGADPRGRSPPRPGAPGQPTAGDPSDTPGADADGQGAPTPGRPPGATGSPPAPGKASPPALPQPASGEAQRQADAAQRRRMQRALDEGDAADSGDPVPGAPARAESAAERERRGANEAWLRRVPDDPGGLLRAKFRLEHERRQETGER